MDLVSTVRALVLRPHSIGGVKSRPATTIIVLLTLAGDAGPDGGPDEGA